MHDTLSSAICINIKIVCLNDMPAYLFSEKKYKKRVLYQILKITLRGY